MKLETSHWILIGVVVLVVILGFSNFWGSMESPYEMIDGPGYDYSEGMENQNLGEHERPPSQEVDQLGGNPTVSVPSDEEENQKPRKVMVGQNGAAQMEGMSDYAKAASSNDPMAELQSANCYPQVTLKPSELLPNSNDVNMFSKMYPEGQGNLMNNNYLQAGFGIGIDTVGQTLRNANLQLRSEPPNPQVKVSPWNQTTIDPDMGRLAFEIGGCA